MLKRTMAPGLARSGVFVTKSMAPPPVVFARQHCAAPLLPSSRDRICLSHGGRFVTKIVTNVLDLLGLSRYHSFQFV
jgi:hypothetical protein